MKLENIGFYTLSDLRASQTSLDSPLWRCELILTDRCNYNCLYCRGLKKEYSNDMPYIDACGIIDMWGQQSLKNIRFSGGEPTLYKELPELVSLSRLIGIKRIAVSTNGSNNIEYYKNLIDCGVNDFSVSLDTCCSISGKEMSGGVDKFNIVINNIRELSELTYVTVGVVITDDNLKECVETIILANDLGVSDIRVIPAAQYNQLLEVMKNVPKDIVDKYKIFNYRYNRMLSGKNVRGISNSDSSKCPLVLDDMAIVGDNHYPCIIYLREQGKPIGSVGNKTIDEIRFERHLWNQSHNTHRDSICQKNCLDVCVDYNNKVSK